MKKVLQGLAEAEMERTDNRIERRRRSLGLDDEDAMAMELADGRRQILCCAGDDKN